MCKLCSFTTLSQTLKNTVVDFCLLFFPLSQLPVVFNWLPQKVLKGPPQWGILQQPPTCCVSVEVAVKCVGSGLYTSHRGHWSFPSCSSAVSSASCPLHNIHTTLSRYVSAYCLSEKWKIMTALLESESAVCVSICGRALIKDTLLSKDAELISYTAHI